MKRQRTRAEQPALLEVPATSEPGARRAAEHPEEFFATPAWVVRLIEQNLQLPGGRWLEPCAGDGAIVRAFAEVRNDVEWDLVELRPEAASHLRRLGGYVWSADGPPPDPLPPPPVARLHTLDCPKDYLARRSPVHPYDVAVTNPPFSLAARVISKLLKEADHVLVLVKDSFLHSKERNAFMRRCTPDQFVIPERPSFDGQGTDAAEYSWLYWPPGRRDGGAAWARLVVLPLRGPPQLELEDSQVVRRLPVARHAR